MTVIEYCRNETDVRELVIIRAGGYTSCAAYIDYEDLFRLPPNIPMRTLSNPPTTTSRFWTTRALT